MSTRKKRKKTSQAVTGMVRVLHKQLPVTGDEVEGDDCSDAVVLDPLNLFPEPKSFHYFPQRQLLHSLASASP